MIEKAHAYLMKTDPNGVSLYDHLVDLVTTTLESNPNNVATNVEKLAAISHEKKKNRFEPHGTRVKQVFRQASEPEAKVVETSQALAKLFRRPREVVTTTIDKPVPSVTVTTTTVKPKLPPTCRSVALESRYFNSVGVGISEHEALLLDLSIAQLSAEKKLKNVRFVGKIYGLRGNYLIIESDPWYADKDHKNYEEKYAMPPPPRKGVAVDMQIEPSGKGLNRYSYWVCSYPSAPWTQLPDVTPQQINAARQIKKYFTGDLNADIVSYPEFPGKELHYLRAQIARITSATTISPVGALQKHDTDADEEEEEEEEVEGQPPKPKEMKLKPLTDPAEGYPESLSEGIKGLANGGGWCHHYQYIYKTGRSTMLPEKPEPEEGEEEPEEEEDEGEKPPEEPEKELLEPVNRDKLFATILLPKEEPAEGEEEEEEPEPEAEEGKEKEEEPEEQDEDPPEGDEEDPRKKRVTAWVFRMKNALYKNHGVVLGRSLRWPGAFAYAAEGGKSWGNVYVGNGLKASCRQFAPTPAPMIMKEADDLVDKIDPPAKHEKLLLRGEEIPEKDSEAGDEPEEEEAKEDEEE